MYVLSVATQLDQRTGVVVVCGRPEFCEASAEVQVFQHYLVIVVFSKMNIYNVPSDFSASSFVIQIVEPNASIDVLTASIGPGDCELWSPEF